MNRDCRVYNKKTKKHKWLELEDSLPFDQDVSEIFLAYIDNLVTDHTPINLKNVVAKIQYKTLPVAPDLRNADRIYTKDSLLTSIMTIYHYICGEDKEKANRMLDALVSSC